MDNWLLTAVIWTFVALIFAFIHWLHKSVERIDKEQAEKSEHAKS
ncbi:hypothetical protein [Stenoxybacter acetivorans]|nr:hypothetical protein [Stenoxybacter acetivorans]